MGMETEVTTERQASCLTRRETEVLLWVSRGKSNKETASILGISMRTVEAHRSNLSRKLGVYGVARLPRFVVLNQLDPLE